MSLKAGSRFRVCLERQKNLSWLPCQHQHITHNWAVADWLTLPAPKQLFSLCIDCPKDPSARTAPRHTPGIYMMQRTQGCRGHTAELTDCIPPLPCRWDSPPLVVVWRSLSAKRCLRASIELLLLSWTADLMAAAAAAPSVPPGSAGHAPDRWQSNLEG